MDVAKLTLETKNIEFEKLIWQNEIQTDDEAIRLKHSGYSFVMPENLFKALFENVPTECVCYTYGNRASAFYWNIKTMAACEITYQLIYCMQNQDNSAMKAKLYDAIHRSESEVSNKDYKHSAEALKNGLSMDYFNMLCKNNFQVNDLYDTFIFAYNSAEYGFDKLNRQTFDWILASKSDEQRAETLERTKELPHVITIYRGHAEGISAPEERSYSWATEIRIANFFATRLGQENSEIIVAEIDKNKIIELIDDRGEREILAKYEDVRIKDRISVWGMEQLNGILPQIYEKFEEYKDYTEEFDFISDVHGIYHTQRVILHILILCRLMNISEDETEILCMAGVYHDVGRSNDGVDDEHGKVSKEIYESDVKNPLPIISFLIEYHSLPDELGYEEIRRNPHFKDNREQVVRLYNIFKDADGLDRVRLGLMDLDINYLRNEYSKHLTKIARIIYDKFN